MTYRVGVRVSAATATTTRNAMAPRLGCHAPASVRRIIGLRQSVPDADWWLRAVLRWKHPPDLRRSRHGMIAVVLERLALAFRATASAAPRTDKKQWAASGSRRRKRTARPAAAP